MACAVVLLSAALLSACGGNRGASGSLTQTLQPCETREVTVDGVTMVLHANADAKLGTVEFAGGQAGAQRSFALNVVIKALGTPHPDDRLVQRPGKWGLSVMTDPCGRIANPAPASAR